MSDRSKLAACLDHLCKQRVLVAGDVMLDRFVYGSISRISPEAPVPVFRSERMELALGGAGNVVRNLVSLGVRASIAGLVGADREADEIRDLLGRLESVESLLVADTSRPTTVKTRFVAERQQVLRVDGESLQPLDPISFEKACEKVREALATSDAVILSDYKKGFLTNPLTTHLIQQARSRGKFVLVDPKGTDYGRYRGASLLTPNLKELREACGRELESEEEIVAAARQMIQDCDLQALLVTRGAQGMTLVEKGDKVFHLRAEAREVFDVTGAGDTVIATMAAAFSAGAGLADAAELANIAAGIVVGKVGTAVTNTAELVHAIHRQEWSSAESKVVGPREALDRVKLWRRNGETIGFTNGVFDLLHHGHLSLLKQAAQVCDRLIVAVNTDHSVRRIRGHGPIQHEATRSAILASLEMIDLVVLFGEDEPLTLLQELKPDVLIKGANYTPDEIVGADLVRSWGGRVVQAEVVDIAKSNSRLAKITKGSF